MEQKSATNLATLVPKQSELSSHRTTNPPHQPQPARPGKIKSKLKPEIVKSKFNKKGQENRSDPKLEDENISENIEALKEQVEIAIKSVDENLIDSMLVGQTKIQQNKAVILSWSLEQGYSPSPMDSVGNPCYSSDQPAQEDLDHQEDGIVLYVAIKMKKKPTKDTEDPNNNTTQLERCTSSEIEASQTEMQSGSNNEQTVPTSGAEPEPEQGRGGSIRSALRRRRAKNNWLRLVTTMRNVDIADCENLFIKDEYRHIVFDENDLLAVINDEYVVKTPTIDENEATPNKRVTWRESLEETFYDTDDECVIVDLPSSKFEFSENSVKNPPRRQITRQFSVEDPGTSPRRPSSGGKSHSAPSSPVKSPKHVGGDGPTSVPYSPRSLRRSRSAERSSLSGRGHVSSSRVTGHTHVYGELQNKVRRVRCRHTSTNEDMWLYGGLNSFNRRVKNRISVTSPYSNQYYSYRSQPRASRDC